MSGGKTRYEFILSTMSILSLPGEILETLIGYLDPPSRANLRCTCRSLYMRVPRPLSIHHWMYELISKVKREYPLLTVAFNYECRNSNYFALFKIESKWHIGVKNISAQIKKIVFYRVHKRTGLIVHPRKKEAYDYIWSPNATKLFYGNDLTILPALQPTQAPRVQEIFEKATRPTKRRRVE